MITDHTAPPEGGVYQVTGLELLTVANHLLRWTSRMAVLARQGGARTVEEREYRLHRAALADHLALTTGVEGDLEDADFTAGLLMDFDTGGRPTSALTGYRPAHREYVRICYRDWLADYPDRDALAPGEWHRPVTGH